MVVSAWAFKMTDRAGGSQGSSEEEFQLRSSTMLALQPLLFVHSPT